MGCVSLGRYCLHNDGHETMKRATKLRALAIEDALALNEAMEFVDTAWSAICLDPKARDVERVKNIHTGTEEANVCTRWQCQALVDLKLAHHSWLQILISYQVALKLVECWDLGAIQILLWSGVVLCLHILHRGGAGRRNEALRLHAFGVATNEIPDSLKHNNKLEARRSA